MTTPTLPKVTKLELSEFDSSPIELLYFITEKYDQMTDFHSLENVTEYFNDDQHTLNAFCILHSEIQNGGFIQLIQNGYGDFIFNQPVSKHLSEWGAKDISDIIEQAKVFYLENKFALEQDTTIHEFSDLYKNHKYFKPIEEHFYNEIDKEAVIISNYIHQNLNHFVEII